MIIKNWYLVSLILLLILSSCGQSSNNDLGVNLVKSSIIASTDKIWKNGHKLTISFLDGSLQEKKMVESYSVEWTRYANLDFEFYDNINVVPRGRDIDILITFKGVGSYSNIGRDSYSNTKEKKSSMTLSLSNASENLKRYYILHEFGHAIGLQHEHQHIDRKFTIDVERAKQYCAKMDGFDEKTCQTMIINPLEKNPSTYFSVYDPNSVMHYSLHPSVSKENLDFRTNSSFSLLDKLEIIKLYPGRLTKEQVISSHQIDQENLQKIEFIGNCQVHEKLVEKIRLNKDNKPELMKVKQYGASSVVSGEFQVAFEWEDKEGYLYYLKTIEFCNYTKDELDDFRRKNLKENIAKKKYGNCEIPLTLAGTPIENNCPPDFQYQVLRTNTKERAVNSCYQNFKQALSAMGAVDYCNLNQQELEVFLKNEEAVFQASLKRGKCLVENSKASNMPQASRCKAETPWFISFDQSKFINNYCYSIPTSAIDEMNKNPECN